MIFIRDEVYWIWLQQALSQGNRKIRTILLLHENSKKFYNVGEKQWRLCGCFTNREIKMLQTFSLEQAEEILNKCNYLGIDVITMDNPLYPERLKTIVNPPCVLYVKGRLPNLDEKVTIGVVGTRSATAYGLQMSYKISHDLAKSGAIVVSGGAIGIDSSAHKGAMNAGGETVLVMGCGINYPYLMENIELRNQVTASGALVSEYPPDAPSLPRNFPMRNRIISGMSLGLLVVEAGQKSGSLITANLALEQNRDLFAIPGNVNSSFSIGTNSLIKECAKVTTCANDILEEYTHLFFGIHCEETASDNEVKENENDNVEELHMERPIDRKSLSEESLKIYDALDYKPKNVETLAIDTGMEIKKILQSITMLEVKGLIKSYSGRRYSK